MNTAFSLFRPCSGENMTRWMYFAGVPCIINQNGVQRILPLSLTEEEKEKI